MKVLKRARVTRHPWLMARDANMSPVEFEKGLWFQKNRTHVEAQEKASTCRSKSAKENGFLKPSAVDHATCS